MRTFLVINPVGSGKIPVVEQRTKGKKTYYTHVAWIDPPGTWHKSRYNLHIDGCDYLYNFMNSCKAHIVKFFEPEQIEIRHMALDYYSIMNR